jgi:hypothetical protein
MPIRKESGDPAIRRSGDPVTLSDCGSSGPARIPAVLDGCAFDLG